MKIFISIIFLLLIILGEYYGRTQSIISYLKILASWPISTFLIFLLLLKHFKEPISKWLENLRIEYNGAVATRQTPVSNEAEKTQGDETAKEDEPDFQGLSDNELKNLANSWRASAYLWEYRYLNKQLVYKTQKVLDWLYDIKETEINFADNYWNQVIPSPEERQAIISVLEQHYLVHIDGSRLKITPKGQEYVTFMGKALEPAEIPLHGTTRANS